VRDEVPIGERLAERLEAELHARHLGDQPLELRRRHSGGRPLHEDSNLPACRRESLARSEIASALDHGRHAGCKRHARGNHEGCQRANVKAAATSSPAMLMCCSNGVVSCVAAASP